MSRLRFAEFELDLTEGALRDAGAVVRLQPQPLKVLMLLAGHAGQIVSRDDIQRRIWGGETFVDFEQGLNYCIRQIRAALRDDVQAPRFIETVPRRGYRFLARVETVGPSGGRHMLIVLPFQNLTGDPEQEYFSDGLTEEVIAELARLNPERLGVIARTSAMRYKNTGKTIEEIGRELRVGYALEGSVRRGAGRVRISAQLIQVTDQSPVWSESFEREEGDALALQADVAQAVARAIGVQLTPQERRRLSAVRSVAPDVTEAYLKGRYFWKRRTRESLQASVEHFSRAIQLDPRYAPAYAGLADAHLTQMDYNYMRPLVAFPIVERLLGDALRLDDSVAEPHTSLGHLRFHQFDWPGAEQQFTRAIALNPGYDAAHYYYANLLAAFGRFDQALDEANRTLQLDPMSMNTRRNRLFVMYLARRYDDVIAELEETLAMDPTHTAFFYDMGLTYERMGDYARALDAFRNVTPAPHSRGATVAAAIAYVQARAGQRDEATAALERLERLSDEYVSWYDLALLNLALGSTARAIDLLIRARDEYSSFLPFINVDARLDPLRADPRFEALVRLMHVPAQA